MLTPRPFSTPVTFDCPQLHEMFQDLAFLVIEQGTLLDTIEYNVEATVQHTAKAAAYVARARERVRVYVFHGRVGVSTARHC